MNEVTITIDVAAANYALLAVRARLEQLRQYHLNHPDLPRQDDVVAIYERAQKALVEAGCDL
jgi:hypothetical protein